MPTSSTPHPQIHPRILPPTSLTHTHAHTHTHSKGHLGGGGCTEAAAQRLLHAGLHPGGRVQNLFRQQVQRAVQYMLHAGGLLPQQVVNLQGRVTAGEKGGGWGCVPHANVRRGRAARAKKQVPAPCICPLDCQSSCLCLALLLPVRAWPPPPAAYLGSPLAAWACPGQL